MIVLERFDPSLSTTYADIKTFTCGHAGIDRFVTQGSLKKQVLRGEAVAMVLVDTARNRKFVGFYTLTMAEVKRALLQGVIGGSMPTRIGCARLVMLGVHTSYQKSPQKLGSRLMKDALDVTKNNATTIGCRGMYLDADANALNFYTNLGFVALAAPVAPGAPTPMFLAIESFF